ncbi:MAG TPA: DUF1835 domain-containing protein [Balneolaceae bacterium]|nr:DUF1835 domain-containing protein [Balneolaceae bacterium]
MSSIFHILNGDALLDRFPDEIPGERIVLRECLMDGNVTGKTEQEFYQNRAHFISSLDEHFTMDEYYERSVSEFEKISAIPDGSEVNLWFEDDLFCQINLWFAVHRILNSITRGTLFLVRPVKQTRFGFSAYDKSGLVELLAHKIPITSPEVIAGLWEAYKENDLEKMKEISSTVSSTFGFICEAVSNHERRIPQNGDPGYPSKLLLQIKSELGTESFGPVFLEFNKRTPEFGYGDLQVKRLFDSLTKN